MAYCIFGVKLILFEILPILFFRYATSLGSCRNPYLFSYLRFFVSSTLINIADIGILDLSDILIHDITIFYFFARFAFVVLAYHWFKGNKEYQNKQWSEFCIIAKEYNMHVHPDNEYYYGYKEGYKHACIRNHVETKEMMYLYPEEFPKDDDMEE